MQKKNFIISLIVLSILGLVTSLYLTYNHYHPSLTGSICDITASVSCTVVNSGIYSAFAGIPVAVYGAVWFIISGALSINLLKKNSPPGQLLWWNIIGSSFVIYFIYIEFLLSTICPLCTVVHVLVVISLILSILLYIKREDSSAL